MFSEITGIILSGGKSSRMGTNKAFLKFGDKFTIEIITEIMKSIFSKVILVTNEPGLYGFLNTEMHEDIYKGSGPLGGIHSGLKNSTTQKNFIISCDIPLITAAAIEFIAGYPSNSSIIAPKADGYIQQLCGIYSKSILPAAEEILNLTGADSLKKCRVLTLVEQSGGEIIDIENIMPGYQSSTFLNMNTDSQYSRAKELYSLRNSAVEKSETIKLI